MRNALVIIIFFIVSFGFADEEFNRDIVHSHPKKDCYGEKYSDGYQMGWIMKSHDGQDYFSYKNDDWHFHYNVAKIENGKRSRSDKYYSEHRQFYCNSYKNGGPKPSQRVYPEDSVAAAPTPHQRNLTTTWASLKVNFEEYS